MARVSSRLSLERVMYSMMVDAESVVPSATALLNPPVRRGLTTEAAAAFLRLVASRLASNLVPSRSPLSQWIRSSRRLRVSLWPGSFGARPARVGGSRKDILSSASPSAWEEDDMFPVGSGFFLLFLSFSSIFQSFATFSSTELSL